MKKHILIASMVLALFGSGSVQASAPTVLFVLDGSGSMWAKVGEQPKIDIAKAVMTDMLRKLPSDVNAGLLVYGHNRKDDCNDIAMLAPIGSDRATIVQALHNVSPKGKTPLTGAIQLAALQLRQTEGSASVVVVSDGKETCEGDPCMAAQAMTKTGANLRIHVVGFDVTPDETQQLNCIAEEGKGKYFAAANAEQLVVALAEVQKEVIAPPPPVEVAQTAPPPPKPAAEVLFEDHFDRDELGESWEVLNLDPNRLALSDGKLLIVGSNTTSNLALAQQPFSGNFVVTVKMDTQITENNWAGLLYWIDEKNLLSFGFKGYCCADGRRPTFTKVVNGQVNAIRFGEFRAKIGDRELKDLANNSETWYLQIERSGVKFIARVGIDGKDWTETGTHTLLQKNGRIGVSASSGGGIENAVEFDDFVVKGAK
jgi:hypothetical protein